MMRDNRAEEPAEVVPSHLKVTPPKVSNIVAHLVHNKLLNPKSSTFKYHPKGNVYTIENPATSSANVIQLGREDASTERGFDYAVAIVSKRTGKVQYVPAKLVNFQATYASDPAPLFGHKPSQRIDYTVDNSGQSETFADERRALTTEFGSHRKIKVQEDFERRRVSEQTLKIMMESTFSSPVAVKKEEQDDDVKTNPLSISCDNQSEVLPKANQNANLPAEVYSTDAFLTEDEISSIGNDAVAYLKRSKEELIASDDCSELLYGIVSNAVTDCRKASLALLLIAMVKSFKMLSGKGKCFLVKQDWVKITSLPASVLGKIRVDFLPGEFKKDNARSRVEKLSVNSVQRDKLLAHILCLILVLNERSHSLPITRWVKELDVTENKMTKFLEALGCTIQKASVSEALELDTIRIARLTGPPRSKIKKFTRRR